MMSNTVRIGLILLNLLIQPVNRITVHPLDAGYTKGDNDYTKIWRVGSTDDDLWSRYYRYETLLEHETNTVYIGTVIYDPATGIPGASGSLDISQISIDDAGLGGEISSSLSLVDQPEQDPPTYAYLVTYTVQTAPLTTNLTINVPFPWYIERVVQTTYEPSDGKYYFISENTFLTYYTEWQTFLPTVITRFFRAPWQNEDPEGNDEN